MLRSLVGSEMCIRDRAPITPDVGENPEYDRLLPPNRTGAEPRPGGLLGRVLPVLESLLNRRRGTSGLESPGVPRLPDFSQPQIGVPNRPVVRPRPRRSPRPTKSFRDRLRPIQPFGGLQSNPNSSFYKTSTFSRRTPRSQTRFRGRGGISTRDRRTQKYHQLSLIHI